MANGGDQRRRNGPRSRQADKERHVLRTGTGSSPAVEFFTKGQPTETMWLYDARTNVPRITKKDRPLSPEHFAEFEKCYGKEPNGRAKRKTEDSKEDRWRSFWIEEVKGKD